MKCVDAQKLIKPYLEDTLPDKEMISFLEHVEGCPDCREDLEIYLAVYTVLEKDEELQQGGGNFTDALRHRLKFSKDELEKRTVRSSLSWVLVIFAETILLCALMLSIRPHIEQRRTMKRLDYDYRNAAVSEAESEEALSERITELPGDEILAVTDADVQVEK